jgi:uncharacterized membrane protein SpoIIM required for sporulation/ABC-type transport system involved in multi-copper enzyme maturation permease subunit
MREDLETIGLVASRELRDQLRDWRIILPLLILILAFPFLMNEVAAQAVSFFARYGTTLIAYRLVPFSILIIGFFPITISLVVALESFVGEKERGTIEPLLNSPAENWHLYVGKLLAGVATPLAASYISIALYLVMVSRQHLQLPSGYVVALLLVLTTAHALLMVSAAIVISVQATSVRAANLLASFVVIPVAIMMQGESVLLFWGTDRVLWLAIAAVVIMGGLLVRLGLAHFHREYLLGRELDTLSAHRIWQAFWAAFRGEAQTVGGWYRVQSGLMARRLLVSGAIVLGLAIAAYWGSFAWTTTNVPRLLPAASTKDLAGLVKDARPSIGLAQLHQSMSAPRILVNNLRATLLVFAGGLVSFGVLGIIAYLINVVLVGTVLGLFSLVGYSPSLIFAAGLLPHGIFEIPAMLIAGAAVLRTGAALVMPQTGRSMGQVLIELIADLAKVFVGLVMPLLAAAALIEAYLTPSILITVLK